MATVIENLPAKKRPDALLANQPSVMQSIASGLPGAEHARTAVQDVSNAHSKGGIGAAIGQGVRSAVVAPFAAAGDVARMADTGIANVGRVLDPAATALRTAVTGDATPVREVMDRDAALAASQDKAQFADSLGGMLTPEFKREIEAAGGIDKYTAGVKGRIASAQAIQEAPAAQAIAAPTMPRSIADAAPGTGMIQNSRTGALTAISDLPHRQQMPAMVQQRVAAVPPVPGSALARSAADEAVGEYSRLMNMKDGGIGAALAAKTMLNRAKGLEGIAASQNSTETARINSGTSAQEVAGRQAERTANMEQAEKVNAVRDQYAALNDASDPDGKQRQALKSKLEVLSGKDGDQYQAIMGKDEFGNPQAIGVLDRRSGKITDPTGKPMQAQKQIPPGMKQVGTANGIPVYEDANGNRFTY